MLENGATDDVAQVTSFEDALGSLDASTVQAQDPPPATADAHQRADTPPAPPAPPGAPAAATLAEPSDAPVKARRPEPEPATRPAPRLAARPARSPRRTRFAASRRADRRIIVLAAVSATAVTGVVLGVGSLLGGNDSHSGSVAPRSAANPSPAHQRLDRPTPPGWSNEVAWSAPISPGTHPALAEGLVALVTADRHLQLRYGTTGAPVWTTPTPLPAAATSSPAITTIDGKQTVVIQVGGGTKHPQLLLWQVDGDGRTPTRLDLPEGTQVTYTGTTPLIVSGSTIQVISGGALKKVEVPTKTTALAVDNAPAPTVIAATTAGTWWLTDTGAPRQITPTKPSGADQVTRVAAAGRGTVALVWSAKDKKTAIASLNDTKTGRVLASASAPAAQLRTPQWVRGIDGKVAALGPVVFDLKAHSAMVKAGTIPLAASGTTIYGQTGDKLIALPATPTAKPTELPKGTAVPWGVATGDRAIVASRTTAGISIYALMPRATTTNTSTTTEGTPR